MVNGTCKDLLFIIGTDMMAPEHTGSCDFLNVGFHPCDRRDVMTFVDGSGTESGVDLASWPHQASWWVHVLPIDAKQKLKKKVKWVDEQEA